MGNGESEDPQAESLMIRLNRIHTRVAQGDVDAIAEFKAELDSNPLLWIRTGDLTTSAIKHWIERITAPNFAMGELMLINVMARREILWKEGVQSRWGASYSAALGLIVAFEA